MTAVLETKQPFRFRNVTPEPIDYTKLPKPNQSRLISVEAIRTDANGESVPNLSDPTGQYEVDYTLVSRRYWSRQALANYLRLLATIIVRIDGTEYAIPIQGRSKKTVGRYCQMALAIPDFVAEVETDTNGEIKEGFGLNAYQAFVVIAIAQHMSIWSFFRNGSDWKEAAWDEIISLSDRLSKAAWQERLRQSLATNH